MIIVNQNKLEQAKQKLQEQKSQLANKIENAIANIQDDDMRVDVKEFLENKYYATLMENEKEIDVIEYIANHINIIGDYFVEIDEKPINDVIDKVVDEYSEDLSNNRG